MIYKLVSSKRVVAKVLADLDIKDEQIRISDMQEWFGEALEKIGAIRQLVFTESGRGDEPILEIKNYQVALPDKLHTMSTVAYSDKADGPWLPMRTNTGQFKLFDEGNPKVLDSDGNVTEIEFPKRKDKYVYLGNYYPPIPLEGNEETGDDKSPKFEKNPVNWSIDLQYFIKPGYIVTNRKEGYLKLAYYALPIDDDGYPLVPDLASYHEALYWYVVMKLKYPLYLNGKLPQHIYSEMRSSWNYYRKQAYGEALMPTEDDMISIKNEWNKMFPEQTEENTFYSGLGERQKIYNQYYGRVY